MKKSIKYVIIGLLVLAAAAGGVYYMMMPLPVRMTEVRARVAELSFTEQGVVSGENVVMVFAAAQGEINGLYVWEGQRIRAGEALLSLDNAGLILQLDQIESGIRGLEAQLANVELEDAAMRQNLTASRNSLLGELRAIDAQAAQTDRAFADHTEALNEQLRIQRVLIDQHRSELNRVRENFERVETLFDSGVATRADFDSANYAVAAAQAQLDAALGQYALIAAGAGHSATEHFEGMRASINAQITGINQQLAQDTTSAARAHFEALIEVERVRMAQIMREIANTTVTAPVDGIITTLHAQATNFITAAAPVAEITVPGRLEVEVYVSTQDVGSIQLGDTVGLTLRRRMGDAEFYGSVIEIDSAAVVRFTALGVEERKVQVRIDPNIPADVQLGIGYALDTTFYVFREENQLTVPRTAVFRDEGQDMVWAVRAGAATAEGEGEVFAIPVVTGMELRTDIIIESGLSEGDFVVNDANNADLANGVRVINDR